MKKKLSLKPIENSPAYRLSCVLKDLVTPVRLANDWIGAEDLPEFVAEIEERTRTLQAFIEAYLLKPPRGIRVLRYMAECDLVEARKKLDSLSQIGKVRRAHSKRDSRIVGEELSKALLGTNSTDFSAEAEELRQLRSGELNIKPPRTSRNVEP